MADTVRQAYTPSREHTLRAQTAAEIRRRNPDPVRIDELRRERAVVRIEDSVRKILAAAPALTLEDRRRVVEAVEAVMGGGAHASA
jgi:hypothetical protein